MDIARRQDGLSHKLHHQQTPGDTTDDAPLSLREIALLANFRAADEATRIEILRLLQPSRSEP